MPSRKGDAHLRGYVAKRRNRFYAVMELVDVVATVDAAVDDDTRDQPFWHAIPPVGEWGTVEVPINS